MSGLEGRARRLLLAYPPGYRAERSEEIIGTLLEASTPGRDWPAPREAWSLIAAGLRARAARNRQQPAITSLRLTLLLAAALWLTWDPYQLLWFLNVSPRGQALSLLGGLLIAATIAAPWFVPRLVTVLLAAGTTLALGVAYYHIDQPANLVYLAPHVVPPLALAAAAAAGPARPPRAWLWLPGALVAASALFYAQHMVSAALASSLIGIAGTVTAYGIVCAAALWLVVDVRPAIAFLIGWEWLLAPAVAFAAIRGTWLTGSYYIALAAPLAAGAVALAIRRLHRNPALDRTWPLDNAR
jgi:hypothetical protein